MLLTTDEHRRLNRLFDRLWARRNGVDGSWGAHSHGYHPTYIRRGPLLLRGETSWTDLWVLTPADCEIEPKEGDSRAHCDTMPKIYGAEVRIHNRDDGPWWDMLRVELDKMEQEFDEHVRNEEEERQIELSKRAYYRDAELKAAMNSIENFAQ